MGCKGYPPPCMCQLISSPIWLSRDNRMELWKPCSPPRASCRGRPCVGVALGRRSFRKVPLHMEANSSGNLGMGWWSRLELVINLCWSPREMWKEQLHMDAALRGSHSAWVTNGDANACVSNESDTFKAITTFLLLLLLLPLPPPPPPPRPPSHLPTSSSSYRGHQAGPQRFHRRQFCRDDRPLLQ